MGPYFIARDCDQAFPVPHDIRQWLPEGHLSWRVLELVEQLDLSAFVAYYRADGQGHRAYHPAMLVALVLYCYCKGIRSSRGIEAACVDDVGCRVVTANRQVDHSTIARFIRRHDQAFKQLFVQLLAVCARADLVQVDLVAGDGTKVKANASTSAGRTLEQLHDAIDRLEAALDAEFAVFLAQAVAGGQGSADDDGAQLGPAPAVRGRTRTADRLERARAAQAALTGRHGDTAGARSALRQATAGARAAKQQLDEILAQQQAKTDRHRAREETKASGGKAAPGRPPLPLDKAPKVTAARRAAERASAKVHRAQANPHKGAVPKGNTTDPRSRVMPAKSGGYLQAYNLQALANRRQIILAVTVHDNPVDVAALHPLLKAARANLDAAGIAEKIGKGVFDAGYASTDNFTTPTDVELYVAVPIEAGRSSHAQAAGKTIPPGWQGMAQHMDTEEAKLVYRQRSGIIEPVFAQLFACLGRHLHYRGAMVEVELHLWALVHNLLKYLRSRVRCFLSDGRVRLECLLVA